MEEPEQTSSGVGFIKTHGWFRVKRRRISHQLDKTEETETEVEGVFSLFQLIPEVATIILILPLLFEIIQWLIKQVANFLR